MTSKEIAALRARVKLERKLGLRGYSELLKWNILDFLDGKANYTILCERIGISGSVVRFWRKQFYEENK